MCEPLNAGAEVRTQFWHSRRREVRAWSLGETIGVGRTWWKGLEGLRVRMRVWISLSPELEATDLPGWC